MKLYHIHKPNQHDEYFQEGAVLPAGSGINYFRGDFLNRSSSYLKSTEEQDGKTIRHFDSISNLINVDTIREMTDEEKIKLVDTVYAYVRNSQTDIRELILEDVRIRRFRERPSRYKCMWLTDHEGLNTWLRLLNTDDNAMVFEVEANGNVFVSTNKLLPASYIPYNDMYKQACHYWDPSKEDLRNAEDREYLVTGDVKLLKRVK